MWPEDERTDRPARTDDAKRASMMDMGTFELECHLVLKSDMYDTYLKVKSATRDCVKHTAVLLRSAGGSVRGPVLEVGPGVARERCEVHRGSSGLPL